MTLAEVLASVEFIVGQDGKPRAAVLEIAAWEALVDRLWLEDVENRAIVRAKLPRLRMGPEEAEASRWEDVQVKARFPESERWSDEHVYYWIIQRRPHFVKFQRKEGASGHGFWHVILEYHYVKNEKFSLRQVQIAEKAVQKVIEQVGRFPRAEIIVRYVHDVLWMHVIRSSWAFGNLESALDFAARTCRLDLKGFISQAANEVTD